MENSGSLGGTWWNSKQSNADRIMLKLGWVELCQLANKARNQVYKTNFIQFLFFEGLVLSNCFTLNQPWMWRPIVVLP